MTIIFKRKGRKVKQSEMKFYIYAQSRSYAGEIKNSASPALSVCIAMDPAVKPQDDEEGEFTLKH